MSLVAVTYNEQAYCEVVAIELRQLKQLIQPHSSNMLGLRTSSHHFANANVGG